MKELKIAIFKRNGRMPEGVYAFKEPNTWYPVVYFRKSKYAKAGEFRAVIESLKH